MIYFGITLRSRAASKNWEMVQRVFNRTLASVWRQTCPEFKVLVACHERPLLWAAYDERLEFLQADTPAPRDHQEMMLDKGWKLSLIAQRVRQLGGGYVMMVDADDLISNRVAAYAAEHPAENGFLSRNGYVYTEGAGYAQQIWEPHRICGSCSIVYYRVEDLPDHMPENLWDDTLKDRWIIRKSHRIIPESMKQAGRELAVLPFPSTIYVRNTGDNHSMLGGSDLGWKRKLELALRPRIPLQRLEAEFYLKTLDALPALPEN